MIDEFSVTVPELSGDKKRRAYVCLPDSYFEDDRAYPVLYMFDGQNVFFDEDATYGTSWGMKDYLEFSGAGLIVAAVECNDGANNERLSEYSPYTFDDPRFGKVAGKGKMTMEWFVNSFKPWVDGHYRTRPGREDCFIAGSSMGGLMSLYALLEYNRYFSGAAALSPSLWANKDMVEELIRTAPIDPNTVLYIDCGEQELGMRGNMWDSFGRVVRLLMERRIKVTARIVPSGRHCEACWAKQVPFFIGTLLYDES